MLPRPRALRSLVVTAASVITCGIVMSTPATAHATDPIDAAKALAAPGVPGANDWSCKPSAAHPRPVVLVHGTFANGSINWLTVSPELKNQGYCVFVLTYGAMPNIPVLRAIAPVSDSAAQLSTFVDGVLAATGTQQVDMVGHSQGGMMPRWYIKFDGGAAKVHTFVGLAPSNHGTTLDGLAVLAQAFPGATDILNSACPACVDQIVGSDAMARLNAGGDTVPGVDYTVIASKWDEVVTPYRSQFLDGPNVHNVTLQDLCAVDVSEHAGMIVDQVVMHETENALDPAHATQSNCLSHG